MWSFAVFDPWPLSSSRSAEQVNVEFSGVRSLAALSLSTFLVPYEEF